MIPIIGNLLRKNRNPGKEAGDIRWIEELPRDNPLAALDTAVQKLAGIVTIEMPLENWRLKALLLIDARCRGFVQALEQQYISVQKLRPELDARMWDTVYAWYRYLSRGYQLFIDDHVNHPDQPGFQHAYLPLVLARAMHHQANIARWRYMRYQGMPDGGWLALHQLYRLAETEGFAVKPIKLYDDEAEITIGERYAEAMMLDTLNHTNMTKQQIESVNQWLGRWLKAVVIAKEFDEQRFLFFSNLEEDRAGRRIRNFKATPSCRYWDTDYAIKAIDLARKALEQGKSPKEAGLNCSCKSAECLQLLNQLFSEWSRTDYQRQRRTENRRPVLSTATVANGLNNVWQQVKDVAQSANNRRGGYIPSDDRSLEERLASHSIQTTGRGPTIAFAGAAGERWMINDESISGLGALVGPEVADWAKLGRLVALVLEENRNQVALGVIRSIKQQQNSQRHIGIEVISRQASVAQLTDRIARPASQMTGDVFLDATLTNPGVISLRGLLIPADEKRGIGTSMILPSAEFNPASIYEVANDRGKRLIKFGNVLEQKDDWVRILVSENGNHAA